MDNIQKQETKPVSYYRFYGFFKQHPVKALRLAMKDQQLKHNETILKCSAHLRRTGFRICRDMSMLMILVKVVTIFAHHRRSLALSAPKNYWSVCIKYLIFPGIVTAIWERDRYTETIENVEGLKSAEIEERYDYILRRDEAKIPTKK